MRVVLSVCLAALLVAACKKYETSSDFESPNATLQSLFRAYGVTEIPEAEIQRRLQARERFDLRDEALFRSCFSDWQGEHDQGLGGYVFGRLVAGKDHLTVEVDEGIARVRTAADAAEVEPVVLLQTDDGWKIDLRQSVPAELRQQLYEVYRRARRAERKAL